MLYKSQLAICHLDIHVGLLDHLVYNTYFASIACPKRSDLSLDDALFSLTQ